MAEINIYLTSLEPNMNQTIYSQSIGGYASPSLLYLETTISQNIGLYDTSFVLNTPSDSTEWSSWVGLEFIGIGAEIIRVNAISSLTISVVQRGYNGIYNMHLSGDTVRAISHSELFNNVFNEDRQQYRCLAIQNDSIYTLHDVAVFVKQESRNTDTSFRFAIEKPVSKYLNSNSTSRTTETLVDTTLIGLYEDNLFVDAYLKPVGENVGGIISSFDSDTGTFVFYSSFSTSTSDVNYEVFPSPAQRIKSGIVTPSITTGMVPFASPSANQLIYIGETGTGSIDADVAPNDLFYLWIERSIEKGASSMDHNDFVIGVSYTIV